MKKKIRAKVAITNLDIQQSLGQPFYVLKFQVATKNKKLINALTAEWKHSKIIDSFSKEFIIEVKDDKRRM
jgi:hypothetical protein